jgi:CubicO group peptidase (beta-lactamase class C family)
MLRYPFARLACVLLLLLAAGQAAAQERSGLPPAVLEKIERLITEEMARQRIPGLSVAVATDFEVRWSNGYGFSDLENFVPAKASTVYRLASISKPITAVAALQLAEKGRLDLDAPIRKYVPGFPEKKWPVTARLLLGHLGGVRHYKGDEIASTRRYESLTDALAIFQADPLLHEPGTKYVYTTYGFNLLGAAVEGASGMRFMDYLRERIFQPAGMEHIRDDDAYTLIPNRAQGYRKTAAGELQNSILADVSNKIPGGGLCSTAEDLARFAVAVQKGTLLARESAELMFTRQKTRDGRRTSYGLGWGVSERDGRREIAHGGGQPRVATYLYMLPDERCAVALMCNLEGARLPDLARRIADAAVGAGSS